MENIIQNRAVDLQSNRYASVIIKQGDRDTRTVIFKLTENGVPYIVPSGVTVYLSGLRADGSAIIQKLTKNADGNYPYTFTEYDTTIYGRSKLEIKLIEDTTDKVLSSMTFVLVVEKSALSDQQIADAGDSRNLFKELVVALENAKNLQSIVDGLKDDVAGVESLSKEISDNEKVRQANEAVRIENEEERKNAEAKRNTNVNSAITSLNSAIDSANDLIEQVEQTDDTAQQTIKDLDDAIDRLNTSGSVALSMPVVSDTMPATQDLKALWFVADANSESVEWENTANGSYSFTKSGYVWTSNNKGVNNSTATSTWQIDIPENIEYTLKYKVSSESSYDKFTLTLDNSTIIANGISGAGEEITFDAALNAGTHTLVAKYVKDSSQSKNDDCAYVILEPIQVSDGSGSVREVAVKVSNNGNNEDYQHHPISTDSIYIYRPNGKTVEESITEIESNISGGSGNEWTSVTIDEELSSTSKNPVANKTITEKITAIETTTGSLQTATTANTSKITALEGNNHTHANSSLLNALSYSDGKLYYNGTLISGGSTTETHTHSNKSVLDLLSVSSGKLYYNGSPVSASIAVDNSTIRFNSSNQLYAVNNHTHSNKSVLDLLSASGGKLYYNGSAVDSGSSSSGNYVPISFQQAGYDGKINNIGNQISLTIRDTGLSLNPRSDLSLTNSYACLSSTNATQSACEVRVSNTGYSPGIMLSTGGYSIYYNGLYFMPYNNGGVSLGYMTNLWRDIWAQNGVIQTSDMNEKKDIKYMLDDYAKSIIMGLKPCSYKFTKNTSDRTHNGMIAQDVEGLLKSIGIDSKDFAAFIKYEKEETEADGNPVYGYGLRYEEFISPLIKFVQYQQHRIENLEERITMLES